MSKNNLDQEVKFRAENEMVQALDEVVQSRPAGVKRSQILREAVAMYLSKLEAPQPPVAGQTARTPVRYSDRTRQAKTK
jgi:metal-responsive CopG/Arc/MetJ family transcriptional regulator